MDQIKKALEDLLARIKDLVARIEESSYYERALNKFDSLEPQQKRKLTWAFSTLAVVLLVFFYLYPLLSVISTKSELASYRKMVSDLEEINSKYKPQAKRTYTPPSGWQNLPANTQDEFLTSVDQFLAQIGVIEGLTKIETQGSETKIDFQELTIKQAVAFLFQMEGWYPGVKITQTQIKAHPQAKELLQMKVSFRYDGAAANSLVGSSDSMMNEGGFEDSPDFSSPPTADSRPPSPPGPGEGSFPVPPPPSQGLGESYPPGIEDFDVPPPPPPPPIIDDFGGDMPPPLEDDL